MADNIQTMIPRYGELNRIYRDYILLDAAGGNRRQYLIPCVFISAHGRYKVLTGRDAPRCVLGGERMCEDYWAL